MTDPACALDKPRNSASATRAKSAFACVQSLAAFAVLLFLAGCASPLSQPSELMQRATPVATPPAGKSLVLIHRPRAMQGYKLYTTVWDSTNLIADLGNGHSVAYVCDPGTHYFINRSVERVGVVEAQVLPNQSYHLRLDTAGAFIASFQLEPVKRGDDGTWKKIPEWTNEHIWVTRGPAAANYERRELREVELIIQDFVHGQKKDRLRHLGPDDHH
jgi:hypothetical protein